MTHAVDLAHALGLRRTGRIFTGRCPHCGYPGAFTAQDRADVTLVRCHVGCDQADVIGALRARGLWGGVADPGWTPPLPPQPPWRDTNGATVDAARLWSRSLRAERTPVAAYLSSRGLRSPVLPTLRFLPDAKHTPSGTRWPVMLAKVANAAGRLVAVHRTYLGLEGAGKAPVEPCKMTLGPCGGASVHLAPAGPVLVIAEGIETALSVQMATGTPTWAALSAGGIRTLMLPPLPLAAEVVIAADHDRVGLAAAHDAAVRWTLEGRRVRIAVPDRLGADFNDLLREGAP